MYLYSGFKMIFQATISYTGLSVIITLGKENLFNFAVLSEEKR
jgi:hypothetical protein